jgi:hypothetical protein
VNFDITLEKVQLEILARYSNKSRDDSKFLAKLIEFVFKEKEKIANCSVTGETSRNPGGKE